MFDWYNELQNTSSKLEKIEILKRHDSPTLRKILIAAYDPLISYGIKIDLNEELEGDITNKVKSDDIFALLDKLKTRQLTGNAAQTAVTNMRLGISSQLARNVFEGIVNRDLRCGISESTINKAFPGLISTFDLMACHTLDTKTEKKMDFPAMLQLKYDAARVAVIVENGTVTYFTRNGKNYNLINANMDNAFILMANGKSIAYDGEMWQFCPINGVASRTVSNGIANKLIHGTADIKDHNNAGITIWDAVPLADFTAGKCKTIYSTRFKQLISEFDATMSEKVLGYGCIPKIEIAETKIVDSVLEAMVAAKAYMDRGLEGAILKSQSGIWEAKRSYTCLKIKAIRDADLKIVAMEEGTGKNKDKMGNLICESSDGKLRVGVGTGFTDVQRTDFWEHKSDLIGTIVTVQYNELISSKDKAELSLFLPRFIELRFDKKDADDLAKIKAGT